MGDFNFPMHRIHTESTYFLKLLREHSLELVPSEPTYHRITADGSQTHTWLDLFIVPSIDLVRSYTKSETPFAGGHDIISLDYNFPSLKTRPKVITSRNFKQINLDSFLEDLASQLRSTFPVEPTSFSYVHNNLNSSQPFGFSNGVSTLSAAVTALTQSLLKVFDSHAPSQVITLKAKNKPWISSDIRSLMDAKRISYRRARTSGRPVDRLVFITLRARVSNSINMAKNRYYSTLLQSSSDPKTLWRTLGHLNITKLKKPSPLMYFTPSTLNQHFAAVSRRSSPLQMADVISVLRCPLSQNVSGLFEFSPISEEFLDSVFTKVTKNCTGPDELSTNMIRIAYPVLRPYLVEIFNNSVEQGIFPDCWKMASIIPLSKLHPPTNPSDTRPVALLPELSKLLERVVYEQFSNHLARHNVLDPHQSGFRPNHSTQTAILGFTEEVRLGIDRRLFTILILFDFSKAFDTVSHRLLLCKLRAINCSERVIRWFASYLTGRAQVVRGTDKAVPDSDIIETFTGVPQGSVLGPLLFSIFINDLPTVLTHSKHGIYADDTRIFIQSSRAELNYHIVKLSEDANRVSEWARANLINLNPSKTKTMILGSQLNLSRLDFSTLPKIQIDNVIVDYSDQVTDLGVQYSSSLNWSGHISQISSRVHGALYSLRFHKHALSQSLRKRLVESLILPHFDYACVVYNDLTESQNKKLHRLLNRCVRFVYGCIPRRSVVTPYRLSLEWLTVENRRKLFLAALAFTVISSGLPLYLFRLFKLAKDDATRRISPRFPPMPLIINTVSTCSLENSFHYKAAIFINSLINHHIVLNGVSLTHFKEQVRVLLQREEVAQWRLRVERDADLSLNPLPNSEVLARLLNV